jgi:SHS family lactate transporter-like MFS transporter
LPSPGDHAKLNPNSGACGMIILDELKGLTKPQRSAFVASLLGWTLDAFDFFLLTFVLKEVAHDFHVEVDAVAWSLTLTLVARPFGALFFGWLADKYGRKPILQIDVALYAIFAVASAFAPNLIILLILRTLFGFAMGGEWGIGASLVMESVPAKSRGVISGLLQEGYAMGQLLGALVFWFIYPHFAQWFPALAGWRIMFMLGVLPAILILFIRRHVEESPTWEAGRGQARKRVDPLAAIAKHWKRAFYVIILMAAFNFFSHGTQDTYTTFLRVQHGFTPQMSGMLTAVMNVGAIIGGMMFGQWSERIGRRRAIIFAALIALPVLPLWAFSMTPLMLGLGGFLMQISVQGAWGVVPVHLNELSPEEARGVFPGAAYQFGNLLAAINAPLQTGFAKTHKDAAGHENYGLALALTAGVAAVVIAVWTWFGPEERGKAFGKVAPAD